MVYTNTNYLQDIFLLPEFTIGMGILSLQLCAALNCGRLFLCSVFFLLACHGSVLYKFVFTCRMFFFYTCIVFAVELCCIKLWAEYYLPVGLSL